MTNENLYNIVTGTDLLQKGGLMATYWLHYGWRVKGRTGGENSIRFTASSDEEARRRTEEILKEFQEKHSDPAIRYFHIRILKEIRTVKEI